MYASAERKNFSRFQLDVSLVVVVGVPVPGWQWVESGNGATTESETGAGRARAMSVGEDGEEVGQHQLPKCCQADHTSIYPASNDLIWSDPLLWSALELISPCQGAIICACAAAEEYEISEEEKGNAPF